MRNVGVVTVARSDYGLLRPILRRIQADPGLQLRLFVGGMHLSPDFGRSVDDIEADGIPIAERVHMLESGDTPGAIAKSMGRGVTGFGDAFMRCRPDIVLVAGDRFEMHAAALAALPFTIPVAHIHGGELTQGAIDDALRHSMTKLSHLHFASTAEHAERILQLGEEPWRVTVSGAPGLDDLDAITLLSEEDLSRRLGTAFTPRSLLVTYHPVTLEHQRTAEQVRELLRALDRVSMPVVFTLPNADTGYSAIVAATRDYAASHPGSVVIGNLGTQAYFSLMSRCAAMVGNSSSGIIEAASFGLPVVNVGSRQQGRMRGRNVIDAGCSADEIVTAIARVVDPRFRATLAGMKNPYRSGRASEIIVDRLKSVALDERLIRKVFSDRPSASRIHA